MLVDGQAAYRQPAGGLFGLGGGRAGTESESQLHFLEKGRLFGPHIDADHGINALPVKPVAMVQLEQLNTKGVDFAAAAMHRFDEFRGFEWQFAKAIQEHRCVDQRSGYAFVRMRVEEKKL